MTGDFLFLDPGADVTRRDIYDQGRGLGMRVVLVSRALTWERDLVDDWIEADPTNPDDIAAKVAARSRPAGVVNCSESCLETAARLASIYGLPGPRVVTVHRCRDKIIMGERLASAGVAQARRQVVTSPDEAEAAVKAVGTPVVLKPSTGVASLFTVRCETAAELRARLREFTAQISVRRPAPLRQMCGRWLVEQYLDGPAFSVESLVTGDAVEHIAVCEKGPLTGPFFREIGHSTPPRLATGTVSGLTEIAARAIRALGIDWGVTHAEFKFTSAGDPHMLEIAARMGGGSIRQVVRLATGVDLVELTLRLALGQRPAAVRTDTRADGIAAASRSLYPPRPGRLVRIDTAGLSRLPGVRAVNQWLRPGESYRIPPDGHSEVCGVVTVGRTPDTAIRLADAAIDAAVRDGLVTLRSTMATTE
jgi:biotin carboxylase